MLLLSRPSRHSRDAFSPKRFAEPIANLGRHAFNVGLQMETDATDRVAVHGNRERCFRLRLPDHTHERAAGFRGVKVWSYGARPGLPYSHPNYGPVFAYANEHAMPVLAHVFGPELDELEAHIRQYPRIRWLLAHIGSAELEKYMKFAREFPTVYVELCLSACPRGLIEHLVAAGLEDKVIWGSDAVFLDQAPQMGRVLFAQIPEKAKRKILGLNAAKALGLK